MNLEIYYKIIEIIKNYHGLSKDCFCILKERFPDIKEDTLASILSHEYQKRMKYNYVKSPQIMNKYYELYMEGVKRGDKPGIILNIAKNYDICPCLIAKLILQKHYNGSIPLYSEIEGNNQINTKLYLRDTTLIEDGFLAYEIYLCNLYDDQYSPIVEVMRMSLGQEYEIKLYREMSKLGLAFRDEKHLRKYGYDKTPDIKLEVPVAVDGFVINWVESKALFGDEEVHKNYMRTQYLSYWNRFGPGLVIYWFGFLETLLLPNEKKILIRSNFPSNIVHITVPSYTEESTFNGI